MKNKILVIEDEKSINYLICTVLTANQYDAIPAYSGQEACTMLQAYCPDLILLDLGLPDMNGVDIIRKFRKQVLPILAIHRAHPCLSLNRLRPPPVYSVPAHSSSVI